MRRTKSCPREQCAGEPAWPTGLCRRCRQELADDLRAIPALYRELARSLTPAPHGGGPVSGGGGIPGLPLDLRGVRARDELLGVSACWAGLVAEQLAVDPPARSAEELSKFLLEHLAWLAAHEAASSAVQEFATAVRRAWRLLQSERAGCIQVGSCPQPGCGGRLTAIMRGPGSEIRCSLDRLHRWPIGEWHTLRTAIPARGLPAGDISTIWRISQGTVYWLANVHGWRRDRQGRRTFYHLDDVCRTLMGRDVTAA
jgi:hypothetical protein